MRFHRLLLSLWAAFFLSFVCVNIAYGKESIVTYYISSSVGNDQNDGLSPESPKQHISSVPKKDHLIVRLRCDDVFFEQVRDYSNTIIECYGEGARPVLCGFKVILNTDAWEYDSQDSLWRIDLQRKDAFGGLLDGDEPSDRINNIGFIYDAQNDAVYGHLVQNKSLMTTDGDFFISSHANSDAINNDTFRYLYWKKSVNPNRIGRLCFPMGVVAMRGMNNCTIRDIAIVGFSKFGIAQSNSIIIENCQLDLIGGALQIGKRTDWVRYGNGIEFWWNSKNSVVRNCIISRTYDCGTSIQGQGVITGSPSNIHFYNNKFYHCRQAFEFFLKSTNDYRSDYVNCSFSNNLCFEMGENEFSSPEPRDANLLSYDKVAQSIEIKGNIFWGAPHFCGYAYPTGMRDNKIYIYKGQYLNLYNISKLAMIRATDKSDIKKYVNQSKDNSSVAIMMKGKYKTRRVERKLWKQLGWKPVDLRLERL